MIRSLVTTVEEVHQLVQELRLDVLFVGRDTAHERPLIEVNEADVGGRVRFVAVQKVLKRFS